MSSISHHYYKRNEMEARTAVGRIESERFEWKIYANAGRLPGV